MAGHPWVTICLVAILAIAQGAEEVVVYNELPEMTLLQSKDAYDKLGELSKRESIIQHVFGTDCYSQALHQVNRDCKSMTTDQKYKLAHAMNVCFLTANGHPGYTCTARMSHAECSQRLDDRAFASYNTFFANIHSLCLYVTNREFERHTAQLLNTLYQGAGAAQAVLAGVVQGLEQHHHQQLALQQEMTQLRLAQGELAGGLTEGLHRLVAIQERAGLIEQQINKTIDLEEDLSRRQVTLANQLGSLEQLERQHAAAAEDQWSQVLGRAEAMERRQAAYEALQEALAASSSALLQQSGQLRGALEGVLAAQQRTSSMLGRLLGGQWAVKDLLFYGSATAAVPLLTSPISLQPARLPLLALLGATAALERLLRQWAARWLAMLPEDVTAGASLIPGLDASPDRAAWALRLLAAAAALYLLLRRAVARRRRETEDRRTLAAIQHHLELLALQQTTLVKYVMGEGPAAAAAAPAGADTPPAGLAAPTAALSPLQTPAPPPPQAAAAERASSALLLLPATATATATPGGAALYGAESSPVGLGFIPDPNPAPTPAPSLDQGCPTTPPPPPPPPPPSFAAALRQSEGSRLAVWALAAGEPGELPGKASVVSPQRPMAPPSTLADIALVLSPLGTAVPAAAAAATPPPSYAGADSVRRHAADAVTVGGAAAVYGEGRSDLLVGRERVAVEAGGLGVVGAAEGCGLPAVGSIRPPGAGGSRPGHSCSKRKREREEEHDSGDEAEHDGAARSKPRLGGGGDLQQ